MDSIWGGKQSLGLARDSFYLAEWAFDTLTASQIGCPISNIGLLIAQIFLLTASLVAIMSMPAVKMHAATFRPTTTDKKPIDK
ncbi:hypothetical protein XANCAGTX0491_008588 [Xanthoria calcicola]